MDEIEELLSTNSPTMEIIKKGKSSLNSIGTMTFKCGEKYDKYRILPLARNQVKKVQCKCDAQTMKKFRTGKNNDSYPINRRLSNKNIVDFQKLSFWIFRVLSFFTGIMPKTL